MSPTASARSQRFLSRSLAAMGIVFFTSWLFVAVTGLSELDPPHVPGVWMALSNYVNRGTVYPPLFDGNHYGGTRYMPLFFVVHSVAAGITGEYVVSGHIVVLLASIAFLGVALIAIRKVGCPTQVAVGLLGLSLGTPTMLLATTTIRGDIVGTSLQLGALTVISSSLRPFRASVSAFLCVLAVCSRSTAVWATVAIVVWLAASRLWSELARFLISCVVLTVAAFFLIQAVSHGRFLVNIGDLTYIGSDTLRSGTAAAGTMIGLLRDFAPATWALFGMSLAAVVLGVRARTLNVYHFAFPLATAVAVVALSDAGTGHNQLIDVVALSPILVASLWVSPSPRSESHVTTNVLIGLTVLWLGFSAFALDMKPAIIDAMQDGGSRESMTDEIRSRFPPGAEILSEDPAVPVVLGEVPVVLDPWMLLRIGRRDPSLISSLVERIENGEFDFVLLLYDLDDPGAAAWYRQQHFGTEIAHAIEERYRRAADLGGLHVYVPIDASFRPTGDAQR